MIEISKIRTTKRTSIECWNAGILEAALDWKTCTHYIGCCSVVIIGDSNMKYCKVDFGFY